MKQQLRTLGERPVRELRGGNGLDPFDQGLVYAVARRDDGNSHAQMIRPRSYFLCGIGGSGMLPLALILQAQGHRVEGSDRALDVTPGAGRAGAKFDYLRRRGIRLHPQDGSGICRADQILVASAAVEDGVPDVAAARKLGARRMSRAELLAGLFNAAPQRIGVAGTSGKSTVTGMIAWILHLAGREPTAMNGAVMKNFAGPDDPFASALAGTGSIFVSEVDESDGSIALFDPSIAVLTNISEDHKPMNELRGLFGDFIGKADRCVVSLDDPETIRIGRPVPPENRVFFSLSDRNADLFAAALSPAPDGIGFRLIADGTSGAHPVALPVPGIHNAANALAAIGAAAACGVPAAEAARSSERICRSAPPSGNGRRRRRRHGNRRFRPQPGQDRRHAGHAARRPRPAAHPVPAPRLRPAAQDAAGFHRRVRRQAGQRRRPADAGTRLFRRHRHQRHIQP